MKQFIENLKETLEIEDHEVKPEDKFRDYEEWDSLGYLAVLAMLKDEYDITIPRSEFDKLEKISDIYVHINKK